MFTGPTWLVLNSSTDHPIPSGSVTSTLMSTLIEEPMLPTLSTARIEIWCSPSSKVNVVLAEVTLLHVPPCEICT